jgi:hypothetical protein
MGIGDTTDRVERQMATKFEVNNLMAVRTTPDYLYLRFSLRKRMCQNFL